MILLCGDGHYVHPEKNAESSAHKWDGRLMLSHTGKILFNACLESPKRKGPFVCAEQIKVSFRDKNLRYLKNISTHILKTTIHLTI